MLGKSVSFASRFGNQPKLGFRNYLLENGILVPKTFGSSLSLESLISKLEAEKKKSPEKLIVERSEHALEFDGPSDLLDTSVFNVGELLNLISCEDNRFDWSKAQEYCKYADIDFSKFESGVSYSYWQYISGINGSVVADDTVEGRYHIMLNRDSKTAYCVFDTDIQEVIAGGSDLLSNFGISKKADIIHLYNRILNLPLFNGGNVAPLIEFQIEDQSLDIYPLQMHLLRPKKVSNLNLDNFNEDGYVKADFVRGATGVNGINANVVLYYNTKWFNGEVDGFNGNIYSTMISQAYQELMSRRREVTIIDNTLEGFIRSFGGRHSTKSQFFKPEVSIVAPITNIVPKKDISEIMDNYLQDKLCPINLHVISNGQEAYVKYLGLGEPKSYKI